jgi:hypothetical protein
MTAPNRPPPLMREIVAPAPQLTKNGRCSACDVTAVKIADGDMKVCPVCYAMLWHADWGAEERRKRAEAAAKAEIERREIRAQHEAAMKVKKEAAMAAAKEAADRVDAKTKEKENENEIDPTWNMYLDWRARSGGGSEPNGDPR